MIGKNWTTKSAAFRLTMAVPPLMAVFSIPLLRILPLQVCFVLFVAGLCWMAFVSMRVTLNEHYRQSERPPFRPFGTRR